MAQCDATQLCTGRGAAKQNVRGARPLRGVPVAVPPAPQPSPDPAPAPAHFMLHLFVNPAVPVEGCSGGAVCANWRVS